MHVKSDSDTTTLYYVQSPSNHDANDKLSYGSPPYGSPGHLTHYHCTPIHHSRESSTSRTFTASVKNAVVTGAHHGHATWKRIEDGDVEDDDDDGDGDGGVPLRFYVMWFVVSFVILFTVFSLILWAASVPYKPEVLVKSMVFDNFNVQSGMDATGVPTDMLTLNTTVKIFYRNPATFFGVHVTVTPIEIHYFQLKFASGYVKNFYQSRKSQRVIVSHVLGYQMPLYGGVSPFNAAIGHLENVIVPVNLTFTMRSRAYILGRLVSPKFYKKVLCQVTLYGNQIGKHVNLTGSCIYSD
ncbi:hypothetical protein HanRHA438_Chr15g0703431 [Helianthus annuus]|uniref:Late embryogenesis abundant protein, LEA_2 subgroup n=1 Tax=Helianthus annuus TaxID=4232 RepID=A0A251SC36_HELAN|nr:uncharacterized protein LOC110909626 [Helianthus annuus]KAF5764352.1 putative Late embryogenesis abundant protein, LEA_2 subgroup [Helianthus annuus]KAJ0451036.1 hypothetical protein HanHA300_Chr15g0563031 [Helianthus annuus]KAJ0455414.1 hypothetical protein HanIR_Chr15g0750921 [Helianthus annuus]KAJ0472897.1 hypothetical protein HanHA89_Chr15g0612251 [Helianthus annuus]KAJ0648504.1 hypothetical protein HanLR1_Chr15g0573671 [Helianthus annuus]